MKVLELDYLSLGLNSAQLVASIRGGARQHNKNFDRKIDTERHVTTMESRKHGARFGELAALDLDHFEPLKRTVRIDRTLSEVNGKIRIAQPKTRASVPAMTLPAWLVDELAQHLTEWPASDGLIFTAPEGGYLRRSFRRAVLETSGGELVW